MPVLLPPCSRKSFTVLAIILLLVGARDVSAQQAMPDPALPPNFNPLCDGSLTRCLETDDFAGHAYWHLQVLPRTERRDTAAVFPFGVALGLAGRFAGGVSTHYAFWQEGDALYQQLGPLRLSLTGRLLPLFPLFTSGGETASSGEGESHYAPPRGFRLGLAYEHEVRVGPFSGANSLGLLTDLAALRLVGSKMLGPIQLSAGLGALYDWRGAFATSEVAAQLGLYLPSFGALKLYVEAMGRGFPAYVNKDAAPFMLSVADSLHPQGVVGGGLSFHPHARVDFSVSVQRGFGGLAPWTVSVNFLTLSVGKTYQGRAATPVAQLAADVATEAAVRLKEFIENLPIDPKLDENCILLDHDNATVLGRFGKRTLNGYYCEQDGFRVPIGHEFERDRKATKLCRDMALKDCFLERRGKEWVSIHRPKLDGRCDMFDSDDTYLGRLGTPTQDGKRCRYAVEKDNGQYGTYREYQEQPIGEPFHTDADRSRVCADAAMKSCFMAPAEGRRTLAVEGSGRYAKRADQSLSKQAEGAQRLAQGAKDVATGNTSVTTIYEEAKQKAQEVEQSVGEVARNPKKISDAAATMAKGLVKAVKDFEQASPERQLDTLGELTGDALWDIGVNAMTSGTGRFMGGGVTAARTPGKVKKVEKSLADAANPSKKARKAAARAAKAEQEIVEHAGPGVNSAATLPTSRAARRESMRQAGIPTSQQPTRQTKSIAGYQYEYKGYDEKGRPRTAIVTQQTTDRVPGHGPHWEAGLAKEPKRKDPLQRLRVEDNKAKVDYDSIK